MGEDPTAGMEGGELTTEMWLLRARQLVPMVLKGAREAKGYPSRWKVIVSKLERVPPCLSDLSSHPFFAKNLLCREQLQSVCCTMLEAVELAACCSDEDALKQVGKLQMQSDLDAVIGKLDLNLRDCGLLVKTGLLGEVTQLPGSSSHAPGADQDMGNGSDVRELLARLQIGDVEAKHRAVDGFLQLMKEEEKTVLGVLGRSNVAALIQLLSSSSGKIREKAATAICILTELGACDSLLVSEGVLLPLIRLAESGSLIAREKALVSLQRMSVSPKNAQLISSHGGVRTLLEICSIGDSVCQAAAAGTIKNLSSVSEIRLNLVEEGAINVMINLLDCDNVSGAKEYAAECLQNITASNESLRRTVVAEGGFQSLLVYIDSAMPQESAVAALRNLVGCVAVDVLITSRLLPRLVHAMKLGSLGAQHAAASIICKISTTPEMKKSVGESGCLPLLVKLLEAKSENAREAAAQAISSLVSCQQNARELKKDIKIVPSLVQLLDPNPLNSAKKYAVMSLLVFSSSKRCKKMMISYGAIGYLKKLMETEVPGARRLLQRLERGKFRSLFGRK